MILFSWYKNSYKIADWLFSHTYCLFLQEGLNVLAKYRRPLLVHAEVEKDLEIEEGSDNDPRSYLTYLKTRPTSWWDIVFFHSIYVPTEWSLYLKQSFIWEIREEGAIRNLLSVTENTRIGGSAEGAHVHVVHLSDASSSLDLIKVFMIFGSYKALLFGCSSLLIPWYFVLYLVGLKEAKGKGDSVTVETCPHYLAFSAEEIPEGDTRFKCSPPIRDAANREKLWEAMMV